MRSIGAALLAGATFAFLSTRFPIGDSDVFWHLATARDFLARGLGQPDALSWTAAGRPVATDQWLGQLLMYASWSAGGWSGLLAFRAIGAGLLVSLIVIAAGDRSGTRPLASLLASLPAIFLARFITAERPELLGFVAFALVLLLLRRGRAGDDRALALCAPLIAVWANVHGSFALGVALIAVVALEGALAEPVRRRTYLIALVASFAASLATPAGFGAWTAPGLHLATPPREIQEWSVPDVRSLPGALFAAAFAATVGLAAFRAPSAWRDVIVLAPLVFLALTAQRQLPYFAIAAAPFIAERLPLPPLGPSAGSRRAPAVITVVAAALVAAGIATGPRDPRLDGYPAGALVALRPGPGMFNQYDWGGYLDLFAPATPVFVDGRLVPYLGAVLDDYTLVLSARPGWRDVVARRGIRQLLVRTSDPVAVRARESGWRIAASGSDFVLVDVP